jgi:molybdopterin/thiamine biosynthesis adenylyltransferase
MNMTTPTHNVRSDPSRTVREFDPHRLRDCEIHVVGLGSEGAYTLLQLAKMGCHNLHGWDNDVVGQENLGNQLYFPRHVGLSKAEACLDAIREMCGIDITTHNQAVDASVRNKLKGIVFLQVHTNAIRKDIWDSCLRLNPSIKYVIDGRLTVGKYVVYGFNPCNIDGVRDWDRYWSPDEPIPENSCRDVTNTGYVACMASCEAVARFVTWYHVNVEGRDYDPPTTVVDRLIHPPYLATERS